MYRNRWCCCVIVCTKRLAWAQLTSDSNSNHSSIRLCLILWVGHLQLFSSPHFPPRWASCNFLSLKWSQIFVVTLIPITNYTYLLLGILCELKNGLYGDNVCQSASDLVVVVVVVVVVLRVCLDSWWSYGGFSRQVYLYRSGLPLPSPEFTSHLCVLYSESFLPPAYATFSYLVLLLLGLPIVG